MRNAFNIDSFMKLGELFDKTIPSEIISNAISDNRWFTEEYIISSLSAIRKEMLTEDKINKWLEKYPKQNIEGKKVAIIMAGNIPLVGFFDLMVVLILKGEVYVKTSSKDKVLMGWVIENLKHFGCKINEYHEDIVVDAIIATGGDSASSFYDSKYPNTPKLLRGSRTSIAIIDRYLSDDEVKALWHDMFDYFSLGCRNVTHIIVKDIDTLTHIAKKLSLLEVNNRHLKNSYKQAKAVYTLTKKQFTDCGYFILKESNCPIYAMAEVSYSINNESEFIKTYKDKVQCIVGDEYLGYGEAQQPTLNDWADGIDTIEFLQLLINRTR